MTEISSEHKPLSHWYSMGLAPARQVTVWISLVIVFVISLLDLAGWLFNISILTRISPHWEPMKFITAVCFIVTAAGLMVIRIKMPANLQVILPRLLAAVISITGGITIYEYLFVLATGKESILTELPYLDFFTGRDTRMASLTAINFFLTGFVLFFLSSERSKFHGIGHIIIIPVSLISYFVPVSYIIGAYTLHEFVKLSVALNTGIAFCFVCIAALLLRPGTWLLKVFMSKETGGVFARRLLPALFLLPVIIGWLRIHGESAGLFESGEGVALVALIYTFCFLILVWRVAKSVNKIDLLKRSSEEAQRLSEEKFKLIATNTPDHILVQDADLRYTFVLNPQLGLTEYDMIGKTDHEILSSEDAATITKIKKEVLETGKPEYVSVPLVSSEGETEYFEGAYVPKHNSQGQIDGIIGYFKNITVRRKMEAALRESEEQYRLLFNGMTEGFALHEIILDDRGDPSDYRFLSLNPAFEKLTGLKAENTIGKKVSEVLPANEPYWLEIYGKVALTGESVEFENYSSELKSYYRVTAFSPKTGYFAVLFDDITNRVLAEKELQSTKNYLENLINYANAPIIVWNPAHEIRLFNHAFECLTGHTSAEVLGKKLDLLFPPDLLKESRKKIKDALIRNWQTMEIPVLTKNNEIRTVLWNSANIYDADNKTLLSTIAQGNDITERIKAEQELLEAKEKLDLALENANIGIWEWNIKADEVVWDERMEKIFGLEPGTFGKTFDSFAALLNEEDLPHFEKSITRALEHDLYLETIFRIRSVNEKSKYISSKARVITDEENNPVSMMGVCFDVTAMREGTEQLVLKLNEELLRSNKELEQFAYVASHDLQEPLRMVSSFTQLLAMRYKDKLDTEAQEFIKFAVEGAVRMQSLINALLEYSRVETRGKTLTATDMHSALEHAINNLSTKIKEKNALITSDQLPAIVADEGQMVQLLQNLLSNAIKFCDRSPVVHISAAEEKDQYLFTVKDNGIGIEPQYFERIFQIFQRLHPKEEYSGTGIGLAVCRRIVERHGGKIWVESKPGEGTSFIFTIKKR